MPQAFIRSASARLAVCVGELHALQIRHILDRLTLSGLE